MHELATIENDPASTDVEFLQQQKALDEIVMVRCPSCGGLRGIHLRNTRRHYSGKCFDCKRGRVIRREEFYDFWMQRFTAQEIQIMGKAIWG